jgi:hypothetical protein
MNSRPGILNYLCTQNLNLTRAKYEKSMASSFFPVHSLQVVVTPVWREVTHGASKGLFLDCSVPFLYGNTPHRKDHLPTCEFKEKVQMVSPTFSSGPPTLLSVRLGEMCVDSHHISKLYSHSTHIF